MMAVDGFKSLPVPLGARDAIEQLCANNYFSIFPGSAY